MDFADFPDKTFMPLVEEMRQMYKAMRDGPDQSAFDDICCIQLEEGGGIRYFADKTRDTLRQFLDGGPMVIRKLFKSASSDEEFLGNPTLLLERAVALRTQGEGLKSEELFRYGMTRYPDFPAQYEGPAFRKELMRTLLARGEWIKAEELIPSQDDQYGTHWHYILFARALSQVGDERSAEKWWRLVLEHEPGNGEARDHLKSAVGATGPTAEHLVVQGFLRDFDTLLIDLDRSRHNTHHFMARLFALNKTSADEAITKISDMIKSARLILTGSQTAGHYFDPREPIPKIVHRIWLTNEAAPVEPPAEYVSALMQEAQEYRSSGWQHYLWIQDPSILPITVNRLQKHGYVKIMRLSDYFDEGNWLVLFRAFLSDRKFPFAADVLRMKILYEYGGVYADMGARFVKRAAAEKIISLFEYAFIFWETLFFQNSLMVMPPKSRVSHTFMRIAENPYTIPRVLLEPLTGTSEGMAFSGLLVTAIVLRLFSRHDRICLLAPNGNVVSWSSQQSWYTNTGDNVGKHGNAYVPTSSASFFKSSGWEDEVSSTHIDEIFVGDSDGNCKGKL